MGKFKTLTILTPIRKNVDKVRQKIPHTYYRAIKNQNERQSAVNVLKVERMK